MPRYSIDKALRAAVLAIPGVAEIIGVRVYADEAIPQGEPMPYASLTLIGDVRREKAHSGSLKTCRARYQVDIFGVDKEQVTQLASLITARRQDGGLDGFKGDWPAGSSSAFVQSCWAENAQHGSIDPASAQEARVYFVGFDLKIIFNE